MAAKSTRQRIGLPALLLLTGIGVAALAQPAGTATELDEKTRAVQAHVLTLDTHVDIPLEFMDAAHDAGKTTDMQVDLPKMRAGGLDAAFFIVYVPQSARTPENYEKARQQAETKFAAIHKMVEAHADQIALATSAAEVRRIHKSGKLVALIGMENGFPMGTDLSRLQHFYDLGARYFGLLHAGNNDLGDSANPIAGLDTGPEHHGLSPLGRQVVAELNRLGIMVDISHADRDTSLQAIAASRAPVIASHSDVSGLNGISRNIDDDTLRALAKKGGVAQIVAFDAYLWPGVPPKQAAQAALRQEYGIADNLAASQLGVERAKEFYRRYMALDQVWPRTDVAMLVNHIDYAVKLIGIDHVGIASDFGGGGGLVGWKDASETANVTRELVRRGYSESDIAKLWGGNLLRVMAEVEKTARSLH